MKKDRKSWAKPPIRILVSIVLLVLCFLMNRHFKIEQTPWNLLQYAFSVLLIVFSLTELFKGISQLLNAQKAGSARPTVDPEHPIKIWTREELFAYLEQDDMIDLDIDHADGLRVSTASDYHFNKITNEQTFFDKVYYINDQEYSDFTQFKEQFASIHPDEPIRILRASLDDNDVILP